MSLCLVPGCNQQARNYLGIRCRKPSTLAVWAPNADAFLCKKHAEDGVKITVDVVPTTTGTVEVTYESSGTFVSTRETPITKKAV